MTKEEAQDKIQSAILDTLRGSGLSPESGVSAMMNAVLNVLSAVSQVIGARKREFIKNEPYRKFNCNELKRLMGGWFKLTCVDDESDFYMCFLDTYGMKISEKILVQLDGEESRCIYYEKDLQII